jgi:hypothetical protein
MDNIISLQETSQNHWRAKYQGHYGVYTIKITTDGKRTSAFSCSCPSGYYPCKHIAMVEEAIAERLIRNKNSKESNDLTPEELLNGLTQEELYHFMVEQLKYNPELYNTVMMKFSHKIKSDGRNKYASIIRRALESVELDEENQDYEGWINLDPVDDWLEMARKYIKQKNVQEAVLIAKACIEEFAQWLLDTDSEIIDWIPEQYQCDPFDVLKSAITETGINNRGLFDYCMSEMENKKYEGTLFYDCFNDLLMRLGAKVDPDAFIVLQEKLLAREQDKSSYEAKKILEREIELYRSIGKPEKAWKLIVKNIQIPAFREEVVKAKIAEEDYTAAKRLIRQITGSREVDNPDTWDDLLLEIAQKEKDTPAIRKISFLFIKDKFEEHHYHIYKSTFSAAEWPGELENLIRLYAANTRWYDNSVPKLLAAENNAERLLTYIEQHLSIDTLVTYHKIVAAVFPEKTLALFRKAVDHYAEKYVGRSHYESIAEVLSKMSKIPGGKAVVTEMVNHYKIRYKNRRAMIDVLTRKELLWRET